MQIKRGTYKECFFSSSVDTCQTLPPGVGLFLVQSDTCPVGNEVSYGSVCSYNCTEGYVIQGGSSLTCGEDGQWLQTLPQCEGQCRWCCNLFSFKELQRFVKHLKNVIVNSNFIVNSNVQHWWCWQNVKQPSCANFTWLNCVVDEKKNAFRSHTKVPNLLDTDELVQLWQAGYTFCLIYKGCLTLSI